MVIDDCCVDLLGLPCVDSLCSSVGKHSSSSCSSHVAMQTFLSNRNCYQPHWTVIVLISGGTTPGRTRSNDLAGRSNALAPPCLLLCFASVIVWTENKNFTISDRWLLYLFYFDSETISAALAVQPLCLRATSKKGCWLFWGKKCIRVTWLEDVLTLKWPGSFAALAPPLIISYLGLYIQYIDK